MSIQSAAISKSANRVGILSNLFEIWPTGITVATPALRAILNTLMLPAKNTSIDDWKQFENAVRTALRTHLDIGHFCPLGKEQLEQLAAYLDISTRMLECLELAAVPNREAIRNRVLLPPEA